MFYVYDLSRQSGDHSIAIAANAVENFGLASNGGSASDVGEGDIDFVDDALLNTAPHNAIEQQLLRGDVVGLALMSGAIIWSAMGAFG